MKIRWIPQLKTLIFYWPLILPPVCSHYSVATGWPPSPFDLRYFMGAECVPVWCPGVLPGVVGLQLSHLANQRAQQRSNDLCQEQGRANRIIWCIVVVMVAIDTHAPRACVCCACITGTITCTNSPLSQVVRYHPHMVYMQIFGIFLDLNAMFSGF